MPTALPPEIQNSPLADWIRRNNIRTAADVPRAEAGFNDPPVPENWFTQNPYVPSGEPQFTVRYPEQGPLLMEQELQQRMQQWMQIPGMTENEARRLASGMTGRSSAGGTLGGSPSPGGGASGADPYAIMRQAAQGLPATSQSVDQILNALRQQGIPAARATHANNSLASDDVIILPDGTEVDLISDVGGAGARWGGFTPSGRYDPSRSVVGPGGQFVPFNQYLQQQGLPVPAFTPGAEGGGGGGFFGGFAGGGASGPMGAFGTGVNYEALRGVAGAPVDYEALRGVAGNVSGLSEAALQKSPGYQFRLGEGLKALERSAASRGTLLTGGTLKGLERYAQDYASNEYANQYARQQAEQQTRYGQVAGLTGLDLSAQQQRYGQLAGLAGVDLGAQNQRYNQLYGLTSLGENAAAGVGNAASAYGGRAGDYLTQIGNAQAAGTVAGANAWMNPINQGSQLAQLFLLSQMMNRGGGGG